METSPVLEESFFGRKQIMDCLEKRFNAFLMDYRQNVGLIGKPLAGKSFILSKFLHSRPNRKVITILIRIDEIDTFTVFAQKWMGAILFAYHRFKGRSSKIDYQGLIQIARRELPKMFKKMRLVRRLVENRKFEDAYQTLINLLQLLHEETGMKILLTIDEFDRLSYLPIKDPFAKLGRAIMLQKDIMYVVSSSNPIQAQEIFKEKLSLLFSNFEVIHVSNLSFEEANDWIDARLGRFSLNSSWKRFLIHLSNAHPYYLDILVSRLESDMKAKGTSPIEAETINHVLTEELFLDRGSLNQHFTTKIYSIVKSRFSLAYGDVLVAIAKGKKKIPLIATFLGRSQAEVRKILQRLKAEDYVNHYGSFYDITDPLFRFWLGEAYYRKRASFNFDFDAQKQEFSESINAHFTRITAEDKKDVTFRIEQLFQQFSNDVIEINSDFVKCPRFTEVHSKPTNGRMFPVFAKNFGTNWLCQVVRERVKEDDVSLFLNDLSKLKSKVQKRVMIALRGVELNAKLLAKESKIELWDLKNLNTLLDLYDQPKVIL